jgi:phosphoglycolate phosphatase-like HAD superfamily hydrolase
MGVGWDDPRTEAIFFDFDGVLVDSVAIKRQAFEDVIAPYANGQLDRCMAYFMTQGGISRLLKFRHVWSNVLGRPNDEAAANGLASEFAERVFERTCGAPFIPGAAAFLDQYSSCLPMYVISGTPQGELRAIVAYRGMSHHFQGVFGSPASKIDIGRQIVEQEGYSPDRVCFVGDATTDRDAARALGLRFIGLHGPHLSPYLDGSEEMLGDLTTLQKVLLQPPTHG